MQFADNADMDQQDLQKLFPLDAIAPPLRIDEGGAVRVGMSRITLALVVVAEYMKRRDERAKTLRAEIEARQPRISREELLARRAAREEADAAACRR